MVPPDIMPYPFGSWLSEAPRADQDRLQDASVRVLAELHGADVTADDIAFLELDRPGDTALRRHLAEQRSYYEWVVADGARSPLIERTFAWLEDHWPASEGHAGHQLGRRPHRQHDVPRLRAGGGARLGDGGGRAARDRHRLDGLPAPLPRRHRPPGRAAGHAALHAARRRGRGPTSATPATRPRDLDFYTMYAALRHAIVMSRVARRQVLFGEIAMPDDPDDMIMHRPTLEQMLDGTYWDKL